MPDEYMEIKTAAPACVQSAAFNTYWTYSRTDNSSFYAMIQPRYYDYANRWVRHWLWWYDGYVPYLHNQESGIFSTRIAAALVNRTAKKVVGGRLMYKNAGQDDSGDKKLNRALKFISGDWSKETDFARTVKLAVKYAAAAGTSLIKLNKDGKGLWTEALRYDSFIPTVDSRGKVIDVVCFLQGYTDMKGGGDGRSDSYYLMEHRYFGSYRRVTGEVLENVPLAEYIIKRSSGTATTGRYLSMTNERVEFKSLPKQVKKVFLQNYGTLIFDRPMRLPFSEHLGVELVNWTEGVSNIPALPFGESLLTDIISELISWDYYYSAFNTDMYLARGRVLAPKGMKGPNARTGNYNAGLDSFLFTAVETANPEEQKPVPIQFDLRSTDWREIRNTLIENIALKTGLNVATIASFLTDNNAARTAREVSTEENETAGFVDDKRALLELPINRILKLVTLYYGYSDNVVIRWSGAGLTNRYSLAEIIMMGLQGGFVSRRKAVEMFNYDDDDERVQKEYNLICEDLKGSGMAGFEEPEDVLGQQEP